MATEVEKFSDRLNMMLNDVGLPRMGQGRQTALADELHVSPEEVSQWLKGESFPRTSTLVKLSQFLGVRSNWLMTGSGKRQRSNNGNGDGDTVEMERPQFLTIASNDQHGRNDRNDQNNRNDHNELSSDAFDIAVTWMKLPIAQRNALRKVIKELAVIK